MEVPWETVKGRGRLINVINNGSETKEYNAF